MARLQVALDLIELEAAERLVCDMEESVDIVEVGTPFILRYGLEAVRRMKRRFPSLEVLCDGKIMDAGYQEASEMFDAGADWVTVMACTDAQTIRQCCQAAREAGGRVMADLLCAGETAPAVRRLETLGVDCAAVHVGVDQQAAGVTPLEALRALRACAPACQVAVAGGISRATAADYLALEPDILIVGGGILGSPDPARAAAAIRAILDGRRAER